MKVSIILYLISVVIAYGALFARFQRAFPQSAKKDYWQDMAVSAILSLCGINAILGLALFSIFIGKPYFYGVKFW